jgi:predicted amidophosphoribosyltransferase
LYESGCRIGELLTLKIKNVSFDDYGAILIVSGKTGSRRVRIISSAPALASWIENHPFKNNPEAFLWVVLGTRNHHEMMSYASVCSLLRKLAKKAGIKKRVNPHSFRHARATHLASFLTEAQLCQHMGWVQGSDMASTYVHLSGRDVDNALLKLHGLAKDEKKEEEILKVKLCPRCQEKNDPIARFCKRCASPLDIKTALNFEEKRKRKDEVVAKVIEALSEDPKIKERIYEVIKKLKLEKEFED